MNDRKTWVVWAGILVALWAGLGLAFVSRPVDAQVSIPAGSTVTSAVLSMHISNTSTQPVRVHRISAAWDEMTVTWATFGSSYDAAVLDSFIPDTNGWSTADVTAQVQAWVNGQANLGLLLEQDQIAATFYESSEASNTAYRPKLEVCYLAPGASGAPSCVTIQRAGSSHSDVQDTYMCSSSSTENNGSSVTLYTGHITGGVLVTLIHFDIDVTDLPSVSIVKRTNGVIASNPDGADVPLLKPGDTVTWTYTVTNTGTVAIARADVQVSDDQSGVTPLYVSESSGDGNTVFDPGEIWLYQASGIAVDLTAPPQTVKLTANSCTFGGTQPGHNAYVNTGKVVVPGASDSAQSSYCNAPDVSIVKRTNGVTASNPDGADVPLLKPGDTVTWTYTVTNTGKVPVFKAAVLVSDDQTGVTPLYLSEISGDGNIIFDPGEVWLYQASGIAVDLAAPPGTVKVTANSCTVNGTLPGRNAYVNTGKVVVPGATDSAQSSYCNTPNVSIVKRTNGVIANDPNGADVPLLKPGDTVTWTYTVTNTGTAAVARADVLVTDDQSGVTPLYVSEISGDGNTAFDPGEVWLYQASGIAVDLTAPPQTVKVTANSCTLAGTLPGHNAYVNTGKVVVPGSAAAAQSSYCNAPDVSIVKRTNGVIASDPDGADVPVLNPGDPITWTYTVTNTGKAPVFKADVIVSDNQFGVTPAYLSEISGDTDGVFDPGEVWLYQATGVAVNLASPPGTVKVVPGVCSYNHTQQPRSGYINIGAVRIPGITHPAQSSYCNPVSSLYKLYFPLGLNSVRSDILTRWQMGLGFEDLPLQTGKNDYDYNDWVVDINGDLNYESFTSNLLTRISMSFSPHARGAGYDHRFHILIPAGVFKSTGTAILTTYDQNHAVISVDTLPFDGSKSSDFIIFERTSQVFPGSIVDTREFDQFFKPQRFTDLVITFDTAFPFTINETDLGLAHGKGLFYDPFLDVLNTGEQVHKGDTRLLSVPSTDWLWPEEGVRIDRAFPDVTFVPGDPPDFSFPAFWWTNFNHCVYDGQMCPVP